MTRDDIIRMAREAGDDVDHTLSSDLDFLERFAALVAATERTACARHFDVAMRNAVTAEREACERACEDLRGTVSMFATSKDCRTHNNAITCCVKAISARGEK